MKKKVGIIALVCCLLYLASGVVTIEYSTRRFNSRQDRPLSDEAQEVLPWLEQQSIEEYTIESFDGLTLNAQLIKAEEDSDKVLIGVHGYNSYGLRDFAVYLQFYHDMGFNILIPDNRAHGESEGTYIGFGWLDRLDIEQWIQKTKEIFDDDIQIVLHGLSMGSSTVLMASGDEDFDKSVKCIIGDCGYSSLNEEIDYQLKQNKLPSTLLLSSANLLSNFIIGYNYSDASVIDQVKSSNTPTLLIHGDEDDFVPTYMVYDIYNAIGAEKELLIIEGAGHEESYITDQELYEKTVKDFIEKYID